MCTLLPPAFGKNWAHKKGLAARIPEPASEELPKEIIYDEENDREFVREMYSLRASL